MKFAWVIEGALWESGAYYQQVYLLSDYLNDFGIESAVAHVNSFKHDSEVLIEKLNGYRPDVLVSFGDSHPLGLAGHIGTPQMCWLVHGYPGPLPYDIPPERTLMACTSKYALERVEKSLAPTAYVPHAFDANVFHVGRRRSARERIGIPQDRPVALSVGTNLGQNPHEAGADRKNWRGILEAFSVSLERVPDALLYLHTNVNGGVRLLEVIEELGIEDSILMSDQERFTSGIRHFPINQIADLYRASNVLLMPSAGEGFGVPLIEAQACGIPVVTTDHGPMTELTKNGTACLSTPHPDQPLWALPELGAVADALVDWFGRTIDPWTVSRAVQEYSVEAVVEDNFLPALERAVEL